MNSLRSQQKVFVTIAFFIVGALVFSGVVLYPIFQGVLDDHEKVLDQKRELMQLSEDKKRSHEFQGALEIHEQEFQNLSSLFVDKKTPIEFFRFLDNAAAAFNVNIEKNPGVVEQDLGDGWESLEVRIVGSGSYPSTLLFLEKIESAPYLLQVKELDINSRVQGEVESVGFTMTIKVFVR